MRARIQVLPLTAETLGPASTTPYVLVIDQMDGDDQRAFPAAQLREQLGPACRGILMWDGDLTVASVDEELHEAARDAVMRALSAVAEPV
jgi:hypothetical protein